MEANEIVKVLCEKSAIFGLLSEEEVTKIVSLSELETFEPGEYIIEYKSPVDSVFVLLKGDAKASLIQDSGKESVFDTFSTGSIFGEASVVTGGEAYATITATSICVALEISIDVFRKLLTQNAKAMELITSSIAEKLNKAGSEKLALHDSSADADAYGFNLKSDTPKKLLVINCGSSSLKYTFFDTENKENFAEGQVDRISTGNKMGLSYEYGDVEIEKDIEAGDHKAAFDAMIAELTSPEHGIISSPEDIAAVGHRVVHGGDTFSEPTLISDEVLSTIESISNLAPLHNPVNLVGIKEAMRVFPAAKQVAVFDTAFHQSIPPQAYLYGLPYEYYSEKKIRRYGFHGTSHYYVSLKCAEYFKKPYKDLNLISAHLGNGGSVCAIEHGKSVDTSMGLTPAEGIIMGTRAGSIDPAALLHLMDSEGMSAADVNKLINKESGLLGLSGISNDMRDIEAGVKEGNNRAVLAYKTFSYSVKKYIGAYAAVLGKVDALIFTGGIGLYNSFARVEMCKGLGALGMKIDAEKSKHLNGSKTVVDISTDDSPVKILVIPTNEELMIARETLGVLNSVN